MTATVASRWYRSPEIILTQDYNQASDIWALGCILGEMMACSSAYSKSENYLGSDDRFMFRGTSCYPISPSKN